jgi:hypothetical protein
VDPDPERFGSASFLPDLEPDRDRHPGHANPDTANPDQYQFLVHVFFAFFMEICPKHLKT